MVAEQDWTDALGLVVRLLRTESGFSQERFAHAIGTAKNQVLRVEHGQTRVAFDTLIRIAIALQVRPAELLERVEALVQAPSDLRAAKAKLEEERAAQGRGHSER